ncbi:MAG: class I adenylate-forming enzyme family protein, partial [Acidimicrobiales bacterium]
TTTHTELAERVSRWRGGLIAAGVRSGDRVAVIASNSEEFVLGHLAAIGVGAISVPLNPRSPAAELARELSAVDPFAAIADSTARETLVAATVLTVTLELQRLSIEELDAAPPHEIVEVPASAPAALIFTSGTAGPPKPAILTHGNLTAGLQAVLSLPVELVGRSHVFLGVIPLFHVFGLNMVLHLSLLLGATLVLGDYVGPAQTADLIERHEVTIVSAPPTLWRALTRIPQASPATFSSIRLAVAGAAKLPPQLKLDVGDRLGVDLSEGYGLTESSAVVASSIATEAPLGSVGRLLPGVEARIVDPDGDDCLVGDPGEVWARGPMVFPGYWGAVEGGPTPLTGDGWLRTGDIAIVDEAGFIAIVGRRKDLIIVSGFNVFPGEVEAVLLGHPDVAQVGVVGEPSEATGEAVVAFVVPEDGASVEEAVLAEYCRSQLARYKVPTRFVVAPDLPIGPTGKLQRNRLT